MSAERPSLFEDFPQDVVKEINNLAETLVAFHEKYVWVSERVQQDPKNTYIALAREWDGIDLIDVQRMLAGARENLLMLMGEAG